jgi:hypothetical protein
MREKWSSRIIISRSNSYTSYLFFTPEKEIVSLVKWSLRLPYTFLSVGSPFIEEGGKMQSKYIAGLFTKRMKDVTLELYMLLCFCCAVDSILHNDPYDGQFTDFFL